MPYFNHTHVLAGPHSVFKIGKPIFKNWEILSGFWSFEKTGISETLDLTSQWLAGTECMYSFPSAQPTSLVHIILSLLLTYVWLLSLDSNGLMVPDPFLHILKNPHIS